MSSSYNIKKSTRGIALIQVLLITAILSVLALFISQTAKEQVKQAQWINDKMQAQIELHSAESLLLFELLTKKNNKINDDSRIVNTINFYDQPFQINDKVTAKIQDQSSLIQLHYPKGDLLKKLLRSKALSENKIEVIIDSLLDWQDIDNIQRQNGAEADTYGGDQLIRNGSVPSISDINHIKIIEPAIRQLIINNTTIYQTGTYSPINAPPDILNALTNYNAVQQVVSLRKKGVLSNEQFSQITGIVETDDMYFYISNYLKIDLTAKVGESMANKTMFIHIKPYAQGNDKPINIFISRG